MARRSATARQWQRHDDAPVKVDFRLRSLEALSARLEQLRIPLRILELSTFDERERLDQAGRMIAAGHRAGEVREELGLQWGELELAAAVAQAAGARR